MDLLHFKFYTTCFKWGDDFMKNPEKKTYFNNAQHCEWIAQEMTRERKYFQGFQEGSIFCRPEWVDAEVKVTRLNVVPLPVEEDDQGLAP